ncbi:lipoyl(octanoyl) transferase LipB [Parasediminibacterium sp. JCM 36343]|uniref:lipoyl(octanoyl) transferase LipB n=1 Tax=Parasediminibacterium sp. JCM 36343 TaxID=3374279 RepID=UPI00397BF43A
MKKEVFFKDLGLRHFKEVWDLQEVLLKQNVEAKGMLANAHTEADIHLYKQQINNHLLFVEHYPVYTLGKSGREENILISDEERIEKGIEFFHINRGGDITFHGPEQLVGYPILDLDNFKTDLGWYLRCLEEVIILTLEEYGIDGDRSPGETGVWLDAGIPGKERKICAMGIRCSRWITMHGFALNVNTNLSYFDNIIPCGIANKQVTSLQKELNSKVPLYDVKERVMRNFEIVFSAHLV